MMGGCCIQWDDRAQSAACITAAGPGGPALSSHKGIAVDPTPPLGPMKADGAELTPIWLGVSRRTATGWRFCPPLHFSRERSFLGDTNPAVLAAAARPHPRGTELNLALM